MGRQGRRRLRELQLDRTGGGPLADMLARDRDREADMNDNRHHQGDQIGPTGH
jgi:hypothetical protein